MDSVYQKFRLPFNRNPDKELNPALNRGIQSYLREIKAKKTITDLGTGWMYCFDENGRFLKRVCPSELEQKSQTQQHNMLAGRRLNLHLPTSPDREDISSYLPDGPRD